MQEGTGATSSALSSRLTRGQRAAEGCRPLVAASVHEGTPRQIERGSPVPSCQGTRQRQARRGGPTRHDVGHVQLLQGGDGVARRAGAPLPVPVALVRPAAVPDGAAPLGCRHREVHPHPRQRPGGGGGDLSSATSLPSGHHERRSRTDSVFTSAHVKSAESSL